MQRLAPETAQGFDQFGGRALRKLERAAVPRIADDRLVPGERLNPGTTKLGPLIFDVPDRPQHRFTLATADGRPVLPIEQSKGLTGEPLEPAPRGSRSTMSAADQESVARRRSRLLKAVQT